MYYFNTFADITGLFTDKEIREMDNLVDMPYPATALSEWYDSAKRDYTLRQWLDDAYQNVGNQAGKTEEVYFYLINHGWEWTRHFNPGIGDSITVEYNKPEEEETKPMTLEEKKTALIKLKGENMYSLISEVVFDITEAIQNTTFRQSDDDSRNIWQIVRDWAWEFEYAYTYDPAYEEYEDNYYDALDCFLAPKLKEYEEHEYTIVYTVTKSVSVKASSFDEAKNSCYPEENNATLTLIRDDDTGEEEWYN